MKKILFAFLFLFSFNLFAQECKSDLQCESLCCHSDKGQCAPHDPGNKLFCSKPAGDVCITSSFCQAYPISQCRIVKTGTINGKVTCALRCPVVLVNGKCIEHRCEEPESPPIPVFNPEDCSNAVDP